MDINHPIQKGLNSNRKQKTIQISKMIEDGRTQCLQPNPAINLNHLDMFGCYMGGTARQDAGDRPRTTSMIQETEGGAL